MNLIMSEKRRGRESPFEKTNDGDTPRGGGERGKAKTFQAFWLQFQGLEWWLLPVSSHSLVEQEKCVSNCKAKWMGKNNCHLRSGTAAHATPNGQTFKAKEKEKPLSDKHTYFLALLYAFQSNKRLLLLLFLPNSLPPPSLRNPQQKEIPHSSQHTVWMRPCQTKWHLQTIWREMNTFCRKKLLSSALFQTATEKLLQISAPFVLLISQCAVSKRWKKEKNLIQAKPEFGSRWAYSCHVWERIFTKEEASFGHVWNFVKTKLHPFLSRQPLFEG